MGLFNDFYSYLGLKDFDLQDINVESCLYCKEVCEVVCESLVLLKNCFDMLLLKKFGIIVVVGVLVDSKCDMMGSWFVVGVVDQLVIVLIGIKEVLGDNGKVIYVKGVNVIDDKGIVDFFNLYENVVQVDLCLLQEMIDEVVVVVK